MKTKTYTPINISGGKTPSIIKTILLAIFWAELIAFPVAILFFMFLPPFFIIPDVTIMIDWYLAYFVSATFIMVKMKPSLPKDISTLKKVSVSILIYSPLFPPLVFIHVYGFLALFSVLVVPILDILFDLPMIGVLLETILTSPYKIFIFFIPIFYLGYKLAKKSLRNFFYVLLFSGIILSTIIGYWIYDAYFSPRAAVMKELHPVENMIKARDQVRKVHIDNLRAGLSYYFEDRASYPDQLDDLIKTGYARNIPKDPKTREDYEYESADNGKSYRLCAIYENGQLVCLSEKD